MALLITGILTAGCRDESATDERPNVLLITLDTVRVDRLGCYGHAAARTPNIDALARRGVRFDRAYAHTPYTLPSHATMLTGLYPNGHGLHVNFQGAVHQDSPSLSSTMQQNGYETGAFVASGVLDRRFGLARGFDVYDDLSDRPLDASQQVERAADEVTANAVKWLANLKASPFLAWVHYYDAHDPHLPPEGFRDFDDLYDGEIAFVDSQVGRLLAELERTGRLANTIVIVTADHGEAFGEHDEEGHGLLVYDTTMHIPLIVAGPDPIRPATVEQTVGLVDLYPTIVAAARMTALPAVASALEGRSFLPALQGQEMPAIPLQIESEYPLRAYGWAPLYGLIHERWKYIRAPSEELYDLVDDPLEANNLSGAEPDLRERLAAQLTRLRETGPRRDAQAVHLGLDARNALSALGYVEGEDVEAGSTSSELADPKAMVNVANSAARARALLRMGNSAAALALVVPLLEISPQSGHLWLLLGSAQLAENRPREAVVSFQKSLESFPSSTERLRSLADALAASGQKDEALVRYREALAIDPMDGQSEGRLGSFLANSGKLDEALVHFQRFVELEPNSPNARTNLANCLFALGRFAEGVGELEHALRADPKCGPAHRAMYTVRRQVSGRPAAIAALRAAIAAVPEDAYYRSRLAFELATPRAATQAALQEADALLRACVQKSPQDPVLLDVLGIVRARHGDFAGATQAATAALRNMSGARQSAPGNAELAGSIQARLNLYATGQPYLE